MIACGFGYDGRAEVKDIEVDVKNPDKKGEHKWDKFIGVYVMECELSNNVNTFLRCWNYRVHVWIKFYLSERICGVGKRPNSWQYLVIFMTSAFWHGFYPGYYIVFALAAFTSFAHKDIYGMGYYFRGVP